MLNQVRQKRARIAEISNELTAILERKKAGKARKTDQTQAKEYSQELHTIILELEEIERQCSISRVPATGLLFAPLQGFLSAIFGR